MGARIGNDFSSVIPPRGKRLLNLTEGSRGRDRSSAIRRAGNMAKQAGRESASEVYDQIEQSSFRPDEIIFAGL